MTERERLYITAKEKEEMDALKKKYKIQEDNFSRNKEIK